MPPIIACTYLAEAELARSPWSSSGVRTITRLLQPSQQNLARKQRVSCPSSISITSVFRQNTVSRRKFSYLMLRLEDVHRFHTVSEGGVPSAVHNQCVSGDKVRGRTC